MSDDALKAQSKMRDRLNEVSPSFCLAKWKQVTLHLHNGHTHSCHHVKSHKVPLKELKANPSALHNTQYKKEIRQDMIDGKRPSECQYCWNIEDVGRLSDRHYKSSEGWANPSFSQCVQAGGKKDVNPSYVEVSFESTCNFKCMYCSPQFSTKWLEEVKKYGTYPTSDRSGSLLWLRWEDRFSIPKEKENPYIEAFWQWWPDLVKDLQYFRLTGGEPLLSQHTWRIVDELIAEPKSHLEFAINSNMGVPTPLVDRLVEKINELVRSVKSFTLFTSVDTTGKQAEYIRYGLDYLKYFENIERVLSAVQTPIAVSFMITVNALSVVGMKDLMERVQELRKKYPMHHVGIDTPYLRNPPHMCVNVLTKDFSKYIDDCVSYMSSTVGKPHGFTDYEVNRVDRIKSWFDGHDLTEKKLKQLRIDFYKMYVEYDKRRATSFLETFPQYTDFWKLCQSLV